MLPGLPNRLVLSHGNRPFVRLGEGRGVMGSKVGTTELIQRSLMAARRLYQFMIAEVESEVDR
jgi:hypothetical protein